MKHILSSDNSIANNYLAELRNVNIQNDRIKFRHNLRRIGRVIGYEISKHMTYTTVDTETPLGIANESVMSDRIVLATILRAGLPLYDGVLDVFDNADSAFVSAYRKHHKDGTFDIHMSYITCPNIDDSVLIITDPMLATGASLEKCLEAIKEYGSPRAVHIVTAIASNDGMSYIQRRFPKAHLWTVAVDEELTAKSYIVPGLGDAGDLAFGPKLQE